MIEHLIENLNSIQQDKRFIFLLREEDCARFHLDETIRLLTNATTIIHRIRGETKGAVCSSLLAIDDIESENPLMISNGDQIFEKGLPECIAHLTQEGVDGGCITFQSTHPRWSYVRLNHDQKMIEAAEKRPISKNAIAGVYFFQHGQDYIQGAKAAIRKDSNHEGLFYISSVLNELILLNKDLRAVQIPNADYITFYSPKKITEYESGHPSNQY